jgi:hypothetical protein
MAVAAADASLHRRSAATIALGASLLPVVGFEPHKSPDDGTLRFSLESRISLVRTPEES